jgi:hypothetical protein
VATFKDPISCFAPIEMIERLLAIRSDFGYNEAVFLDSSSELADCLDAYGFDIYAFNGKDQKMDYGMYRSTIVPSGDSIHSSLTVH